MAVEQEDPGVLRDSVAHALAIADDLAHHLIAALLAQCLDELDRSAAGRR